MDSMPPLEGMAGGDVSGDLAAILQAIAQITEADTPKYSPSVHRRLVRWIVCRSYAGPLRELCHLVIAAERVMAPPGYETMFWATGPARPAAFRSVFEEAASDDGAAGDGVERLEAGISVTYGDGSFGIAYTRMPFLSALMEFLVSVAGYADLDTRFRAIPPGQITRLAVDAMANELARETYHYLSAHLPSAQSHRKFRAVMSFLRGPASQSGDTVIGPHCIDDEAVLAFWIFASVDQPRPEGGDGDFRTFKAVFRLMASARDALAAAARASAIGRARPIGTDVAAGEVDPGDISPEAVDAALSSIHERRAPLDVLGAAPASQIKFLKQTEIDAIGPIVEYGEAARALPLSVLRARVMGAQQARLTQALRRGADPLALTLVDRPNSEPGAYDQCAADISQIGDYLRHALLASFHHLMAAQREEAVTVSLYLQPSMDLSPLAPVFEHQREDDAALSGNVIHLKTPDTGDRFMRTLTAGLDCCPDLVSLIGEASAAARRMARKGFKDSDWDGDSPAMDQRADACAAASDALIEIRDCLLKFAALLQGLARRPGGWRAQYSSDLDIFNAQFRALYGDRQ